MSSLKNTDAWELTIHHAAAEKTIVVWNDRQENSETLRALQETTDSLRPVLFACDLERAVIDQFDESERGPGFAELCLG